MRLGKNCLLCLFLLAGCANPGSKRADTVVLPLDSERRTEVHVESFDAVAVGNREIAVAWVEQSRDGDQLRTCVLRRRGTDGLMLDGSVNLIDTGSIWHVDVFEDGDSYGVLYDRYGRMICRRFSERTGRALTSGDSESVATSAALSSGGTCYVVSLLRTSDTNSLVAFALTPDSTFRRTIMTVANSGGLETPSPKLRRLGDSVEAFFLLRVREPSPDPGRIGVEVDSLVRARLRSGPHEALAIESIAKTGLPATGASTSWFEPVGSTRLLVYDDPTLEVVPIPGERPSASDTTRRVARRAAAAAVALSDSQFVAAWIANTVLDYGIFAKPNRGEIDGGMLDVRRGTITPGVRGFPIETMTTRMSLGTFPDRPFVVWPRKPDRDREDAMCIRLLPAAP